MGKRWHRLLRFLGRAPRQQLLLLEALLLLGISRARVRLTDFRRIAARLGTYNAECIEPVGAAAMAEAYEIAWAVNAAARHTWWTSNCLPRAMTAHRMLTRRGLQATVYLGAAREDQEGLIAHAWLRSGPAILTGASGHRRYTVVGTFASPADPDRWPAPEGVQTYRPKAPGGPGASPPPGLRETLVRLWQGSP